MMTLRGSVDSARCCRGLGPQNNEPSVLGRRTGEARQLDTRCDDSFRTERSISASADHSDATQDHAVAVSLSSANMVVWLSAQARRNPEISMPSPLRL